MVITLTTEDKIQIVDSDEYNAYQINRIKKENKSIRESSKGISFSLQYFGTPNTLQRNCGFSIEESNYIYNNYHSLYKISDNWVSEKIKKSKIDKYIDCAFGLRLRTPYMNGKAERTVGNAVSGQSYGLLNNRAANEFRRRVLNSKYKYDIQIVALIHDAIYLEFKSDIEIAKWVNDNLIECMQWNELPELQHDIVKLSAELDIFYPSWSNPITIKNNMNCDEIKQSVINKRRKK